MVVRGRARGNESRDCLERIGREPRREGKSGFESTVKPIDYHRWKREADQTLSFMWLGRYFICEHPSLSLSYHIPRPSYSALQHGVR